MAPVGNPYGSYVGQLPASYPPPAAHQEASYPPPAAHQEPSYPSHYLAAPDQAQQVPAPDPAAAYPATASYLPPAASGQLAGGVPYADPPVYQQPGYPPEPYDQRGYVPPETAYSLDPYSGYPGYGTPAR
jgi:hypothetical protein